MLCLVEHVRDGAVLMDDPLDITSPISGIDIAQPCIEAGQRISSTFHPSISMRLIMLKLIRPWLPVEPVCGYA